MNLSNPTLKIMSLLCFILSFVTSCSKDADLLSDYVIAKNGDLESIALLVDDQFFIGNGQSSIIMDVLNNDNFNRDVQVTIVETSSPQNGEVVINADNTLTYTPQTVASPTEETSNNPETTEIPLEDTFTYTTEVTTPDEEVSRQEATVTISPINMGELLAFPGAEGFGKYTTGGRGGTVIHVTNLNDSGPGSFRDAIETNGSRIIVFDVGGEIKLDKMIKLGVGNTNADPYANTLRENVTIAGETAPYPGITIRTSGQYSSGYGALLNIQASNVILRYLTFRVDDHNVSAMDALQVINPWYSTNKYNLKNVIIDHVSISNGSDENFALQGLTNGTIQNCMITNNDNFRNVLFGKKNYNISFIGNYLSHTSDRNILVGYGMNGETSEYINNIIYGYEEGMNVVWGNNVDVIGNIYKSFINNKPRNYAISWKPNEINNPNASISDGSFYFKSNIQLNPHDNNIYNADAINYNSNRRVITNSLITKWETTQSGIQNRVFGDKSPGNSLHQDSYDEKAISDYFNNSGGFDSLIIPKKVSTTHPTNYDTDNDGMSDEWEKRYFGNLSENANGDFSGDGYTNIEVFFNWLAKQ